MYIICQHAAWELAKEKSDQTVVELGFFFFWEQGSKEDRWEEEESTF